MAHRPQPGPLETSDDIQNRDYKTRKSTVIVPLETKLSTFLESRGIRHPAASHTSRADRKRIFDTAKSRTSGFSAFRASSVFPERHEEQPEEAKTSRPHEEGKSDFAYWRHVCAAFRKCGEKIKDSPALQESEVGKDWLRIIETRMDWLLEDSQDLRAKVCQNWDMKLDVEVTELQQICRKCEDKLLRLRSGAMDVVAVRPSKAVEEYEGGGLNYDQKVRKTVREAYERCAKARKTFIRAVDEAAPKSA